jgi:hypothetical protein
VIKIFDCFLLFFSSQLDDIAFRDARENSDPMAEISMRLKQLKHFLQFFAGYSNPIRINTIIRMDQKIPHSWPSTP